MRCAGWACRRRSRWSRPTAARTRRSRRRPAPAPPTDRRARGRERGAAGRRGRERCASRGARCRTSRACRWRRRCKRRGARACGSRSSGSGRATGAVARAGGAPARRGLHGVVYTAGLKCKRRRMSVDDHDTGARAVASLRAADRLQPEARRAARRATATTSTSSPSTAAARRRSSWTSARCATTRARWRAATCSWRRAGRPSTGTTISARRPSAGAVAAVVDDGAAQGFPGVRVRVASSTRALAMIAANRWGRPADAMTMIAVTGTNGKTTTTFLVEALARAAGGEPGVIGTVDLSLRRRARDQAPFTTPTPLVLHATLAEMRDGGVTHVAMEASSHALELGRLDGLRYRVAAFTNLTQDHLDFHGTMEAYAESKAKLFREHLRRRRRRRHQHRQRVGRVHAAGGARPRAGGGDRAACPTMLVMRSRADRRRHRRGAHDADRRQCACARRSSAPSTWRTWRSAVGIGVGARALDARRSRAGSAASRGVPGRVERVPADERGLGVFVDYAHTPDALERVMAALRPLARGRLIVVFGCGGDRDQTKRPKMGRAVARDADLPIVTSDNPRTEDPRAIIDMIVDGRARGAAGAGGWRLPRRGRSAAGDRGGDRGGAAGRHRAHRRQGSRGLPDRRQDEAPLRRSRRGGGGAREISQSAGERSELKAMAQPAIPLSRVARRDRRAGCARRCVRCRVLVGHRSTAARSRRARSSSRSKAIASTGTTSWPRRWRPARSGVVVARAWRGARRSTARGHRGRRRRGGARRARRARIAPRMTGLQGRRRSPARTARRRPRR